MFAGHERSSTVSTDRSKAAADNVSPSARAIHQLKTEDNQTGMPDQLKTNMESHSGMDLSAVRVHYNSAQPAQLNALAYAQGTDIHLGPGQEQHLPHEAWHVVQQQQGRVRATTQLKETVPVNDDPALEKEADVMGGKALNGPSSLPS
jgi:D-lyxose ketol-isomerase